MNLVINGEPRVVENVSTVLDLLKHFKIDHKILVVELNRLIVDKEQYDHTSLKEDDRIEIVHFVGGG